MEADAAVEAPRRRVPQTLVVGILVVALMVAVTVAVGVGPVRIGPLEVGRIVARRLFGVGEVRWTLLEEDIVWNLRVPRALLGVIVGGALATAGVLIQATVRNPLADPYLLGVSQGASVGAVAFIVLGIGAFGVSSVTAASAVGAAGAFGLVYLLATAAGTESSLRVVLAGVAVGYAMQSVVYFLLLLADSPGETNNALFWIVGSLAAARWSMLLIPAVGMVAVLVAAISRAGALNALLLGDENAIACGVDVTRFRRQLLVAASLLTGVAVSVSGAIGFVGLVVPHGARLVVGGEHRRLLPVAALAGSLFLVLADLAARVALSQRELPIGVVTGLVGAPIFALLLVGRRRQVEAG